MKQNYLVVILRK